MEWLPIIAVVLVLTGCSQSQDGAKTLTLATTTSTRDSGLLDVLVPMFEEETGITVKIIAVGSGQSLELGRRGDADVLLTHAPEAEEQFMAEGHGEQRRGVMHNDFLLVRPPADPANVKGTSSIVEAFRLIARSKSPFVSRGDESGTHMKERTVWQEAGMEPQGTWYVSSGAGMAEVLRMANEMDAYTLADRSTFLAQRERFNLIIHSEGDPLLRNPYSVVVVSPENHPDINHEAAVRFSDFLLSPNVQQIIGEFGVERFGQPLFFPRATAER
jgi:tungstate transport system substrate-binding protein